MTCQALPDKELPWVYMESTLSSPYCSAFLFLVLYKATTFLSFLTFGSFSRHPTVNLELSQVAFPLHPIMCPILLGSDPSSVPKLLWRAAPWLFLMGVTPGPEPGSLYVNLYVLTSKYLSSRQCLWANSYRQMEI